MWPCITSLEAGSTLSGQWPGSFMWPRVCAFPVYQGSLPFRDLALCLLFGCQRCGLLPQHGCSRLEVGDRLHLKDCEASWILLLEQTCPLLPFETASDRAG